MAELVVAMMIITGVLLVLMAVQTSALVSVVEAGHRQQATAYANGAIEQMRAMPYAVLSRGLDADFKSASGGDPYVSGTTLTIEGVAEEIVVANATGTEGAQNRLDAWPPLFDSTGSNKTVNISPEATGAVYTTRAYVTEGLGGAETLGMTIVVTWEDNSSGEMRTDVYRTTAYAPSAGCSDLASLESQPFLSSCQARFSASSSSASLSFSATANLPDLAGGAAVSIMPGREMFTLGITTSQTRASLTSQQVTNVDASLAYGGERVHKADGSDYSGTYPRGFELIVTEASDDTVSVGNPGIDNTDVRAHSGASPNTITSAVDAEFFAYFDSDQFGAGSTHSSVSEACAVGVAAGTPCAQANIGGLTKSRVRLDYTNSAAERFGMSPWYRGSATGTAKESWVARFSDSANPGTIACTTVTNEGCVAAGASASSASIHFSFPEARVWKDSGNNDAAWNGIVYITAYQDEVKVERGHDQKTTAPVITRSATLWFWDDDIADYVEVPINVSTNRVIEAPEIPVLTWTPPGGNINVIATTTVTITGDIPPGLSDDDPECVADLCKISASVGAISVSTTYEVTVDDGAGGTYEYEINVGATLTGSQASAGYRGAPDA